MADLGFAVEAPPRGGRLPRRRAHPAEREQGPVVKRVGLMVEGRQPVREGAAVVDADGREVGSVTSRRLRADVGAPIAMAYVPAALAAPGTRVRSPSAARSTTRPSPRCPSFPTAMSVQERK